MDALRKKSIMRLTVYIAFILLVLLYRELSRTGFGIPCFFYENFHVQCISCGMSRATLSILDGNFVQAAGYHPIYTLAIFPILFLFFGGDMVVALYRLITGKKMLSPAEFLFRGKRRYDF